MGLFGNSKRDTTTDDDTAEMRHGFSRAAAAADKVVSDLRFFEQENGAVQREIDEFAKMLRVPLPRGLASKRLQSLRAAVAKLLRR